MNENFAKCLGLQTMQSIFVEPIQSVRLLSVPLATTMVIIHTAVYWRRMSPDPIKILKQAVPADLKWLECNARKVVIMTKPVPQPSLPRTDKITYPSSLTERDETTFQVVVASSFSANSQSMERLNRLIATIKNIAQSFELSEILPEIIGFTCRGHGACAPIHNPFGVVLWIAMVALANRHLCGHSLPDSAS